MWQVHPTMAERRSARQTAVPFERRRRSEPRASLPGELLNGWLAFESRAERRRLAPPPPDWAEMSDDDLAGLLERAVSRGKPRRLIE